MQITDTHGNTHQLILGESIWLDSHQIGRSLRTHNTLIVNGFVIPHEIRRRSVGSVVLHVLERHAQKHGVTHIQVVLTHSDPVYEQFFSKHGYMLRSGKFEKFLL